MLSTLPELAKHRMLECLPLAHFKGFVCMFAYRCSCMESKTTKTSKLSKCTVWGLFVCYLSR